MGKESDSRITRITEFNQIIFLSFLHSQGNQKLQQYLLQYVRNETKTPKPTQDELEVITDDLFRIATKYTSSNQHSYYRENDHTNVQAEVNKQVKNFSHIFSKESLDNSPDETEIIILDKITHRDSNHLSRKFGRNKNRESTSSNPNPYSDNYFSYLIWFGVLGNTTNRQDLDKMYRNISQQDFLFDVARTYAPLGARFNMIEEIWNERHPDHQATILQQ